MQKYTVIGLGNFGSHIAKSLREYGSEVTGIDINKERLLEVREHLNHAITGDATDMSFLQTISLKNMDGVLVSVGRDMGALILILLALKELDLKKVIACAYSENHCRAIERLGVSDVIFPDRDTAIRVGKTLSMRNVLDYIPLTGDYVVMNIHPPKSFIGKNIRDLQIGARFQCQILGIKYLQGNAKWNAESPEWENMKIAPTADDIIPEHSVLLFLGKKSDLLRIQQLD
ncbi:MAG: TrkA family potassium uptake protein [Spirochaetes bacterium]|nr:TrkA family potassium uptake protein [Spirochaetota bacterium]